MSAIVKACQFQNTIKNTGVECNIMLGPTAMIIAIKRGQTFTDADLADPVSWMTNLIHAAKSSRVFPLFGQNAPIREINNDKEQDILVTLDDGSKVFLRYGFYSRTFGTTSGGLGYAKALQGLNKSGYSFIEIDQQGLVLCRDNGDGTYSGLVADLTYSPAPTLPDMKSNVFKNHFLLSYSPQELVSYGIVLENGFPLLQLMGLINAKYTTPAVSSTTALKVGVVTQDALTDLVSLFGTAWNSTSNFIVTNTVTGATVTISGVTNASGTISLAGTFTSGTKYTITSAAPSVLKGNLIQGYEIVDPITITIP